MATQQEVTSLYQQILGRDPDAGGLANYMQYGADIVRRELLNSAEYRNRVASGAYMTPYTPPAPAAVTPFESVLPYDKIFNPNLIQSLAESQVLPDVNRQQASSLQDYYRNLGATGGFRSGVGIAQKQNIMDQYKRQGQEEVGNFSNTINNLGTDWYNKLKINYNQQPGMFMQNALPTFDQFLQQNPNLGNLYSQGTSTNNQYSNPFKF